MIVVLLIVIGAMSLVLKKGTSPLTTSSPANPQELASAQGILEDFFDSLSIGDFEHAANLISLQEWEAIEQFTPSEESHDTANLLRHYCENTQTCLTVQVLDVREIDSGKYIFIVQFITDSGDVYVFGPCCGATEEEMPSKREFEYVVEKVSGVFKVTTLPLYRP